MRQKNQEDVGRSYSLSVPRVRSQCGEKTALIFEEGPHIVIKPHEFPEKIFGKATAERKWVSIAGAFLIQIQSHFLPNRESEEKKTLRKHVCAFNVGVRKKHFLRRKSCKNVAGGYVRIQIAS